MRKTVYTCCECKTLLRFNKVESLLESFHESKVIITHKTQLSITIDIETRFIHVCLISCSCVDFRCISFQSKHYLFWSIPFKYFSYFDELTHYRPLSLLCDTLFIMIIKIVLVDI